MAPDQPAANPLCMIWTLIRRPGSLRITICTLNQGNLILWVMSLNIGQNVIQYSQFPALPGPKNQLHHLIILNENENEYLITLTAMH